MIVAHKSTFTCVRVPTRGIWGHVLPEKLDPLRLLLMQPGTRLLFNTCDKTILNFKILGRGLWLGRENS